MSLHLKSPRARKIKKGVAHRSNSVGADLGRKTGGKTTSGFPPSGCDLFGLPQLDGSRSERRKFPDLHLRSSIVFGTPGPPGRVYMTDSSYRNEKRHYCQHNAASHLDDYY